MTDHTVFPDYDLEGVLDLTTTEQFKAIGDPTRQKILGLLGQRASTTKQVAEALQIPKGTAGHHLKALEAARLIKVVRTRQVRAITEKYYGLVARLYRVSKDACATGEPNPAEVTKDVVVIPLRQAISEYSPLPEGHEAEDPSQFMITHARVPASLAREFNLRVEELSREFRQRAQPGEKVYGFIAGIYLSNWPDIPAGDIADNDDKEQED
jgi:DNA-binding transcriptional ArsR family regulator